MINIPGDDATGLNASNPDDPEGNVKELGPLNSNTTKIGVIHNDAPPTLDKTNPNGQVDLRQAWINTKNDGPNGTGGDDWIYFAWERDANTGSGFIAYEFMQKAAPTVCGTYDPNSATVLGQCNPWANRDGDTDDTGAPGPDGGDGADVGDFFILWDQQGGSKDLFYRKWLGTAPNLTLSAPLLLDTNVSRADYSVDGFRGEAAINVTDIVFGGQATCLAFANIIPSTVTGNSDTADYKDTILQPGVDLSNCGTTTTTTPRDSAGAAIPADGISITQNGVVEVKDRAVIALTGAASGTVGGTIDFTLCRANDSAAGPGGTPAATSACDTTDPKSLLVDNDKTVVDEDGVAGFPVTVTSSSAWVTAAGRYCWKAVYSGNETAGYTGSSDESVGECFVIKPVTPSVTTTASDDVTVGQTLSDTATVTGLAPKPTTAVIHNSSSVGTRAPASGTVTFELYGPGSCATKVHGPVNGSINTSGVATTPNPQYVATEPGTYSWKATFNGDNPNNTASATHNTACDQGLEDVVVSKKQPTISTAATTTAVLGSTITDKATVAGGYFPADSPYSPGTVTFKLYGPFGPDDVIDENSCVDSGDGANLIAAGGSTVNATVVAGSTTSVEASATPYAPNAPGTYLWVASYSGNGQNLPVSGTCADANEASIITRAPADIATAQSFYPQDSVTVSATVGGTPTGTVVFKLFGPDAANCSGTAAWTSPEITLNAGQAATNNQTFVINAANAGAYHWLVSYSGDASHLPNPGVCKDETSSVSINNNAIP
ncbi:hemagglutinin [Humibacillus xanthopallidus]|uniref:hemagglutinin n=1 Tax=Humibacillus xanthopallidus TaxID=412689 RepID=UPI0021AB6989|nr:hemagglutinin [Humibacillus xanthopallidus]